jgi:hypothetical protein
MADTKNTLAHALLAALRQVEAERDALCTENAELRLLLARYRDETPLGNQPHMIAHQAEPDLRFANPIKLTPPQKEMQRRQLVQQAEPVPVALWALSGDGYSGVFLEQSEPPEPLTVEEALAKGWRRFYSSPQQQVEPVEKGNMPETYLAGLLRSCADAQPGPLNPHWTDEAKRLMRWAADALRAADVALDDYRRKLKQQAEPVQRTPATGAAPCVPSPSFQMNAQGKPVNWADRSEFEYAVDHAKWAFAQQAEPVQPPHPGAWDES